MLSESKIAVAGIVVATAGLLATDSAFARKHLVPATAGATNQPSIEQRMGLAANLNDPPPTPTGTWTRLLHPFPGPGTGVPVGVRGPANALLLTDGSVVMHDGCTPNWYRLIPDNTGNYANGTWSAFAMGDSAALAPMIGSGTTQDGYGPLFYPSVVLPDSRLIVQGGEYEFSAPTNGCNTPNNNTTAESLKGSLYNPHTNTWTAVPAPAQFPGGWTTIGDSNGILLGPNNLTGAYSAASYMVTNGPDPSGAIRLQSAIATIPPFPGTTPITWTITSAGKADQSGEENFALLPNGMVLTIDNQNVGSTNSELFDPSGTGIWSSAGTTPVSLVNNNGNNMNVPESGPLVSLGFNMAVQFGANNHTAVFTYKGKNPNPAGSSWTAGPDFPPTEDMADAPAALMPNGNILAQTSLDFQKPPSLFWEFPSGALTPQNPVAGPAVSTVTVPPCGDPLLTNVPAYQGRMLVLPTGQVLWDAGEGVNCTSIYTSLLAGTPNPIMRPPPRITSISSTSLNRGNTYSLTGSILRGVSAGAYYGEDAGSATNYPMVRITNNAPPNHVCWGRTHDWALWITTQFDVPPPNTGTGGNADWALYENPCDPGLSTLVVITNGLVSNPITVTIQ